MLRLVILIVVIALLWLIGIPILMIIKRKKAEEWIYWYSIGTALLSIVVNIVNYVVMFKRK